MYYVCDSGAMSDVCWSSCTVQIDEVVIGSMNPKAGCAGSVLNLLEMDGFNHKVKVTRGILEEECSAMLSDFFRELRQEKTPKRGFEKPN